jgi:hypothetical protein
VRRPPTRRRHGTPEPNFGSRLPWRRKLARTIVEFE